MRLRLIERLYYHNSKQIYLKDLKAYIREGNDIQVFNEHGMDITKSCLINLAFGRHIINGAAESNKSVLADFLELDVSIDKIYLIIEEGGIDEYISRRRRELI